MSLSRRDMLKASLGVTLGLVIPVQGCASANVPFSSELGEESFHDEGFIQVLSNGDVNFVLPRDEMGQGINHGLSSLVAEELNLSHKDINVVFAPVSSIYENEAYRVQGTWGSSSMREHYLPIRQAAANVRDTLIRAASQQLGASADTIEMAGKELIVGAKRYPIGDFVATAQKLSPSKDAKLKDADKWQMIGQSQPRVDVIDKVTGVTQFGIDIDIPDMYRATVIHSPAENATIKSLDSARALKHPGVLKVVTLPHAIAVIAKHYYQALEASKKIDVTWEFDEQFNFNSATLRKSLEEQLASDDGIEVISTGDDADSLSEQSLRHSASYFAPYLAHMTMEPMNCSVKLDNDKCDIWVGTQSPEFARNGVADVLGMSRSDVVIHNQFMGGGFGRRVGIDFIVEAVQIAEQAKVPVQMIWTRKEDTQNDYYRPPSLVAFDANVDAEGKLQALHVKRTGPNIFSYLLPEALPAMLPSFVPKAVSKWLVARGQSIVNNWTHDRSSVEGLFEDYQVPNLHVEHFTYDPGIRNGYWRAVGHSHHAFFIESFIDELAHLHQQDPVQFRLNNLADERLKGVLRKAVQHADWERERAEGVALGVAVHRCYGTSVAQVAEVLVEPNSIKVQRVVCAVDCGTAVNPDIVKAQMEGGIIFGLSAALYGQIDFKDGQVQQSNFHDQPVVRMQEAPEVEVHIISSTEPPTGVGEPGVPPIAPAVGNAIFAATGQRLRTLPLKV